jgi:hypothetical protein
VPAPERGASTQAQFFVQATMHRRPTMTSLLVLLLFVNGVPATEDTLSARDALPLVVRLHSLDWNQLSADEVAKEFPQFERTDASIPESSQYRLGPCGGSVYLQSHSPSATRLEFEIIKSDSGRCGTKLRAISAEIRTTSNSAQIWRLRTTDKLRATGPVGPESSEYQWRSTDSHTKFILTLAIDHEAHGDAIFSFKLRHISASPDMIDGLPFEKGFFPPVCSRRE